MLDHEDAANRDEDAAPSEQSADEVEAPPDHGRYLEGIGHLVGNCTLLEQVGEGGFGTVWKASQERPLRRIVAVKIIKPGMDSREVVARFAREKQVLAMMEHPGIATIYDAGSTAAGRPFFVMEFVDGVPVTRFCDSHRLDVGARLHVMLDICAAVQHAHQKGIIHRDLKPTNILAAGTADKAQTKVIDFGVARAMDEALLADENIRTAAQQFIGTPAYMSPEQAMLGGMDVDTRSDIYSLGILLYQLLTGTTPFAARTTGATMEEVRRIVRDETPPTPSTALSQLDGDALDTVTESRNTALGTLTRLLRQDLDWIVIKALEKNRDRRYQTVEELSADLRRYLTGEPVLARPPGLGYQAGKFLRHYRNQAMAAGAFLLALAGSLVVSMTMLEREQKAVRWESAARKNVERETARLRTESSVNEETAKFLADILSGISPDEAQGADQTRMRRALSRAVESIGTSMAGQPEVVAFLRNTIGGTFQAMGLAPEARAQYEAGLEVATDTFGPEDRLTLKLRANLANLMDDPLGAEKEIRDILVVRRQHFPLDDRETLVTMSNLATVLADQAKQGDREKLRAASQEFGAAAKLQEEAFGKNDPDTLHSRVGLANTRCELGENVVDEYQKVVGAMVESPALGAKHPDTLEARYGLANAYLMVGDLAKARREHEEAWRLRKEVLGKPHKKTLRSGYMVGRVLLANNPAGAADVFREVLLVQEQEESKGRLKPKEALTTRIGLAAAAGESGKHFEAATQLQRVIADMKTLGVPPADKNLLSARKNLTFALGEQERISNKVAEMEEVLETMDNTLGTDDNEIVKTRARLIELLETEMKAQEGSAAKTRQIERRIHELRAEVL